MSHAHSMRPAPGTLTRRVWDIADAKARAGTVKRADVVNAFVAEGGNPNTASTQFHYWKQERQRALREAAPQPVPVTLQVKEGGRIVLPAHLRALLEVKEGDALTGKLVDGELRLMSRSAAIRRAQEIVRRHVPEGTSLVDQLLADRRTEFGRELDE